MKRFRVFGAPSPAISAFMRSQCVTGAGHTASWINATSAPGRGRRRQTLEVAKERQQVVAGTGRRRIPPAPNNRSLPRRPPELAHAEHQQHSEAPEEGASGRVNRPICLADVETPQHTAWSAFPEVLSEQWIVTVTRRYHGPLHNARPARRRERRNHRGRIVWWKSLWPALRAPGSSSRRTGGGRCTRPTRPLSIARDRPRGDAWVSRQHDQAQQRAIGARGRCGLLNHRTWRPRRGGIGDWFLSYGIADLVTGYMNPER